MPVIPSRMSAHEYRQLMASQQLRKAVDAAAHRRRTSAQPPRARDEGVLEDLRSQALGMSDADLELSGFLAQGVDGATTPSGRKRKGQPEFELHVACMDWVHSIEATYPVLEFLHHSPNGGMRPKGEAGKLKAQGTKAGFPDLYLPARCAGYRGLASEVKSPVGRLSADQRKWLRHFHQEGYLVGVCRTLEEFQSLLMSYLQGLPAHPRHAKEILGSASIGSA